MALIITGETECAICGAVIQASDEAFGTAAFISDPSDRFYQYSDAPFHKRCFDTWSQRERFTRRYEEFVRRSGGSTS
jgi:hypothetical protein